MEIRRMEPQEADETARLYVRSWQATAVLP